MEYKKHSLHENRTYRRQKLCRPLGLLETMYHVYYGRGVDMYAQMASLTCSKPVTRTDVVYALQCLIRKHPLMRMCIKDRGEDHDIDTRYFFQEMDSDHIDVYDIYGDDTEAILLEETKRVFDFSGPLWRFSRVWKTSDDKQETSTLRIMFCCHHAMVDGVYLGIIFADFIEYLDLVQRGLLNVQDVKEIKLCPAVENIIPITTISTKVQRLERVICAGTKQMTEKSHDALTVYEKCFESEIMLSEQKQHTSTNRFRIPSIESNSFISECKYRHCTVTGASIAAASRAFGLLVKPYLPNEIQVLDIPIEVMVNLRRYVTNVDLFESYPGVAAIHVPITVRIPLQENLYSQDVFWYLARQCSDELRNIIASYEPVKQLYSETREEMNTSVKSGKSKYVICLTNLSQIDNVVKHEQSERFTLQDFPGCTNIAMDDMPIFYIGMYSMQGQLNFDIGHCAGYTSSQTATTFCRNLVSSMHFKSRL